MYFYSAFKSSWRKWIIYKYAYASNIDLQDDKENIVIFINKIGQQTMIYKHEVYSIYSSIHLNFWDENKFYCKTTRGCI